MLRISCVVHEYQPHNSYPDESGNNPLCSCVFAGRTQGVGKRLQVTGIFKTRYYSPHPPAAPHLLHI